MPVVTVRTWESSLDEASEERLIAAITDAVTAVLGEGLREHTTVLLEGVPERRWGSGGVQASAFASPPEA
jgi:4-oxalocrotonate tautomerase